MRNILDKKNKRGQVESILTFFIVVVGIFVVSIIVLKLTNTILTPFEQQIGNVSSQAGGAVTYAHNKFVGIWDTAVVLLFFVNVILLFISAFFIDVHPAFVIVYIIAVIFLFIFGNYYLYIVDAIWNFFATPTEIAQSPMQIFIIDNFQLILLGIVILSGILMYAKMKFFGQQGVGVGGQY